MNDEYLKSTAKDYDMPIADVRSISKKYPNNFYEKLEEFIKERANKNKPQMEGSKP